MVRHSAAILAIILRGTESASHLACTHQPISLTAKGSAPLGQWKYPFDGQNPDRA